MKVYIYCIFDENEIPIYIGKTKNSLTKRESQHQKRLKQKVNIFELDYIEGNNWKHWECYWIEQFKQWGFELNNQNKGGGGPESHSLETRNKMSSTPRPGTSIKLKGVKRPDVSNRMKGVKFSEETCQKITQSKTGHQCYSNPERTLKIVESNLIHYQTESDRNKKISEKLIGRETPWVVESLSKPILQYDKQNNFIQEWKSASEAARFLNKTPTTISLCCNKKQKTSYGFIWKFKN
jgi:group I intron endonuclease